MVIAGEGEEFLTARQQQILDFIKRYSARQGYPPTVREIGRGVGLSSSSTVHAHLTALEQCGRLSWIPGYSRTIRVVDG